MPRVYPENTPEFQAQRIIDAEEAESRHQMESAEKAKTQDYEAADTERDTAWGKIDTMTKDEFKAWVKTKTNDPVVVALALEVARLRRKIG